MPKALCFFAMAVAVLLLLLFGLDLAMAIPFAGASQTADFGMIFCSAVLGYLSWASFREQR